MVQYQKGRLHANADFFPDRCECLSYFYFFIFLFVTFLSAWGSGQCTTFILMRRWNGMGVCGPSVESLAPVGERSPPEAKELESAQDKKMKAHSKTRKKVAQNERFLFERHKNGKGDGQRSP